MVLLRILRNLAQAVHSMAKLASVIFIMAILLIMASQIFFRYVLNSSLHWSEELSIWLMIWTVFIGSVLLIKNWEHIFIPTLLRLLPIKIRSILIIFSKIIVFVFLIILAFYGWKVFTGPANAFSFNVGISSAWAKLSVPVGSGLMSIIVLTKIIDDIVDYFSGDLSNFENFGKLDQDNSKYENINKL